VLNLVSGGGGDVHAGGAAWVDGDWMRFDGWWL